MPAIERSPREHGRPVVLRNAAGAGVRRVRARRRRRRRSSKPGSAARLDGTNVLQPRGRDHHQRLARPHRDSGRHDRGDRARQSRDREARRFRSFRTCATPTRGARSKPSARCVGAPFVSVADTRHGRTAPRRTLRPVVRRRDAGAIATSSRCRCSAAFQQENAATAIRALETAAATICGRRRAQIEEGFARLVIPGRMEFFPSHPSVVFDVAHNRRQGAATSSTRCARRFPDRRFSFVIAIGDEQGRRPRSSSRSPGCPRRSRSPAFFGIPGRTRDPSAAPGEHRRGARASGAGRSAIRSTRSRSRAATPTRATSSSLPARRSSSRRCASGGSPTS